MNFLITGGSGFVGSNLIKKLKNLNHNILNIDKKESVWHQDVSKYANISDESDLNNINYQADTIIHLAAEHRDDVYPKSLYYEVNVEGTKNIVKLAERNNINSIIFFSSVAVYGFAEEGTNEQGDINPFNDYGSTKWLAELELKKWLQKDQFNRKLVVIRPTVIFGPRNRGNFYNLINQIYSNKFLMVGDGKNYKSLAYIDNVIDFVIESFNFSNGEHCYNYVDKPDMEMKKVIHSVYNALNLKQPEFKIPYYVAYFGAIIFDIISILTRKKFSISSIRVKKFCMSTSFETSISDIGFKANVSLEEAIIETVNYEFNNKNKDNVIFYTE
tara:strand:- start:1104 stop:2090 length:987 start_codon:yes stop_codon:yes gene_type:complete